MSNITLNLLSGDLTPIGNPYLDPSALQTGFTGFRKGFTTCRNKVMLRNQILSSREPRRWIFHIRNLSQHCSTAVMKSSKKVLGSMSGYSSRVPHLNTCSNEEPLHEGLYPPSPAPPSVLVDEDVTDLL